MEREKFSTRSQTAAEQSFQGHMPKWTGLGTGCRAGIVDSDEPTSGLDYARASRVFDQMVGLPPRAERF